MPSRSPIESRPPSDAPAAPEADDSKTSEERELLEELANTSVDEISRRQRLLGEIRRVRRRSTDTDAD